MKHLTNWSLLLFAIFSTTFLIAQNKTTDQLVEEFLGSTNYKTNVSNNPGLIEYLKVKSSEGYIIDTVPQQKMASYKEFPQVFYMKKEISASQFAEDIQSEDFNFLKYSFQSAGGGDYILDKNQNIVISIRSDQYINRKIRRSK
jgi:hypothetical protein